MSKFAEKYANDLELHKMCRDNGVKYLALFGSSARDDSGEDSDLDFLYRLRKGMTYFQFYDLLQKLKSYFGREIDAVPADHLRDSFRKAIAEDVEVLYEE
jgi:hypothetical protein